jgi:hypothetical protein
MKRKNHEKLSAKFPLFDKMEAATINMHKESNKYWNDRSENLQEATKNVIKTTS